VGVLRSFYRISTQRKASHLSTFINFLADYCHPDEKVPNVFGLCEGSKALSRPLLIIEEEQRARID
jgi:hypothetical protein